MTRAFVWTALAAATVGCSTGGRTGLEPGRAPQARLGAPQASSVAADRPLGDAGEHDAAIDRKVAEIRADLIKIRRHIHANPELGNREFQTAKMVAEHLTRLGLEVKTGVARTGVIGVLKGGRPGPMIAVRADMDALPITEATGLPYASKVVTTKPGTDLRVGVMHACGHDIHTTCLLGTATVLASMKDRIAGTIKFIFQPAEEGPPEGEEGGAQLMVKEGVLNPPPASIFALHCDPELAAGQLGWTPGPMMAAADHFRIRIVGKGGHAAWPWLVKDPIVTAAQVVIALQTIHSRNLDTRFPAVVSVGAINGGNRFNIIPDDVVLEGTVRTFHEPVRRMIHARMKEIAESVAASAGCRAVFEMFRYGVVTANDEALTEKSLPALIRTVGKDNAVRKPVTMGAEDFCYFSEKVPGFYYRLGTRDPKVREEDTPPLHSNLYAPDEACIEVGVRSMCRVLLDALERGGR
jgi:amidohydrolase